MAGKKVQTQCDAILEHLRNNVGITQLEAIEQYGILRLASRIHDLREQGYNIASVGVKKVNRYGDKVRIAEYRLVGGKP